MENKKLFKENKNKSNSLSNCLNKQKIISNILSGNGDTQKKEILKANKRKTGIYI